MADPEQNDPEDTSFQDIRLLAMRRDPDFSPFSTMYTDVRCRQLEDRFPGDCMEGVWPISAQRISRGWGSVVEHEWPSVGPEEWPGIEPEGLDAKAKPNRIHSYQRIRDANDCRVFIAHQLGVGAAFEITEQWFNAPSGMIMMPRRGEQIIGSHMVSLFGFDIVRQVFTFQNSWGGEWGVQGVGFLPFQYFDKYLVESWVMHGLRRRPAYYDFTGVDTVGWGHADVLGHSVHGGDVLHCREVYDGTTDEYMGWTFAVHRRGYLDVEEFFVRPQYRGRGIANQLIEMLLELSREIGRPLRLWVPFADWSDEHVIRVRRIAEKLGLSLYHSGVRWAAAVGLLEGGDNRPFDPVTDRSETMLPKRVARFQPKGEHLPMIR
jgi:GNAT superfamily N-acetyltransferase